MHQKLPEKGIQFTVPLPKIPEIPRNELYEQLAGDFSKFRKKNNAMQSLLAASYFTLSQKLEPSFHTLYKYYNDWYQKLLPFITPLLDPTMVNDQKQKLLEWLKGVKLDSSIEGEYIIDIEGMYNELETHIKALPSRKDAFEATLRATDELAHTTNSTPADTSISEEVKQLNQTFDSLLLDITSALDFFTECQRTDIPEIKMCVFDDAVQRDLLAAFRIQEEKYGEPMKFIIEANGKIQGKKN
jgi:hypothetical protein